MKSQCLCSVLWETLQTLARSVRDSDVLGLHRLTSNTPGELCGFLFAENLRPLLAPELIPELLVGGVYEADN